MTMIFWALDGTSAKYLETSPFIKEAKFHPSTKKRLKTLAEKRIKGGYDPTRSELDGLQKLVSKFVKQELRKEPLDD